jgi:hypothetical protein
MASSYVEFFAGSAPFSNGRPLQVRAVGLSDQAEMGSGRGQGQCFDFAGQAALVARSLVFVEDAFVGNDVHHFLHFGKQFGCLGLVAGQNGLFDVFHGGAVLGTQRGVGGVDLDVLANAFTARRQTGVFFFGLVAMVIFLECLGMMPAKPKILACSAVQPFG